MTQSEPDPVAAFAACAEFGQGAVENAGVAGVLGNAETIEMAVGVKHASALRRSQKKA